MRTPIALVAVLAVLAPCAQAQRKPKPPEAALAHTIPSAAAPGVATALKFVNAPPGDVVGVWASFPAELEDGRLTPAGNAPIGVGAIRVLTTGGVSGLQMVMIDDLPTIAASENNATAAGAQVVPTPSAVEGVTEPLGSRFYRFAAKAGQGVAFEVVAQRLGFRTDPLIRLTDSAGRELAYCDDTPGLGGDVRLAHTFNGDGDYLLELRDANYGGGPEYRYRLRIGDFPVATVPFPLAGKRGAANTFALAGLPDVSVKLPADARRATFAVKYPGGRSSGFVSALGADTADLVAGDGGLKIAFPAAVSGRFAKPGERHTYSFDVKKGDRLSFRGQTRSLQAACDLSLACMKPDGGKLGESKSGEPKPGEPARPAGAAPDEGTLDVTIPEDGTYSLVVKDLNQAGGPEVAYRLLARRGGDFSLAVDDDTLDAAPGQVLKVKVKATRERYDEAITLALTGDAARFPVKNQTIAKGKNETELQITIPDDATGARRPLSFTVVGTAQIAGNEVVRTASTALSFRKQFPRFLFVPPEFDGLIGLGVRGNEAKSAAGRK